MPSIKPFCGFHYNLEKITDLTNVICPPYDVIKPDAQRYYHNRNPYNIIRMVLGRDIPGEDKYKRAADYFNAWTKEKILIQDKNPAIYFYQQQFNIKGERKERLGFIALLRLEDKENKVYPHEHTHLEPKEDRLRLIKRVKANLSPIFVLFSDQKRIIRRTYEQHLKEAVPFIDIVDEEKISHKIWRLDSEDLAKEFQSQMDNKNIFIADGHHRYEVALAFREEMRKRRRNLAIDYDFNYIMAYFTNIESKGLSILPVHRLVNKIPNFRIENFKESIKDYFDIQELNDKSKFFFLMEKAGARENTLGMYKDKKFYLLRLKNIKILDKAISDKPKEYRSLDVNVLNHIVLRKFFNLDLEDKSRIKFTHDCDDLIWQADSDRNSVAFLLNPVKIEHLVSIAAQGQRLPPKTTFFYPKIFAGLLINKFDLNSRR